MMKNLLASIVVVCMALAFPNNVKGDNQFKLIGYKNYDRSVAKRTVYDIEVAADIQDDEVKKVLEIAVKKLANKRQVDCLRVRLFLKDTKLPYATATWAPYGEWVKADSREPKSTFRTSIKIYPELRPKKSSNVEKFGLSLEKRKMIYREISQSQKRTRQIATQKYPSDWSKQGDYMFELDEKYEKQICDKYNITDDQKNSVLGEGVSNNWSD